MQFLQVWLWLETLNMAPCYCTHGNCALCVSVWVTGVGFTDKNMFYSSGLRGVNRGGSGWVGLAASSVTNGTTELGAHPGFAVGEGDGAAEGAWYGKQRLSGASLKAMAGLCWGKTAARGDSWPAPPGEGAVLAGAQSGEAAWGPWDELILLLRKCLRSCFQPHVKQRCLPKPWCCETELSPCGSLSPPLQDGLLPPASEQAKA